MSGYILFAQEKDAKPSTEAKTGSGESTGKQTPPGGFELPLILGAIFFIFYFVVMRPRQRLQEKERQSLLSALNKNDKVLTIAGIYGTVVSVSDKEDEVVVKVDDNTRIKMQKAAISRNLTREEALKASAEEKARSKVATAKANGSEAIKTEQDQKQKDQIK